MEYYSRCFFEIMKSSDNLKLHFFLFLFTAFLSNPLLALRTGLARIIELPHAQFPGDRRDFSNTLHPGVASLSDVK